MYVLYGTEEFLIKREITKIKEEHHIEDVNISTYNLEETKIEEIIDDASTISLFSDNKMIICENAYIFTGTTNKKLPEQNMQILEEYISHENEDTILIFTVIKDKLDERKKIVKRLKEQKKLKEFNKPSNIYEFIVKEADEYQISKENQKLLLDRIGDNLYTIHQEIEKLKQYKDTDKAITKDDILNVTVKNVDIDIFNLIDSIVSKQKEKALESYNEMLKLGEEPIKIIIMLANQFRIMYQARNLYKKGYSEKDIASLLNIHPYRIKLALNKSQTFTDEVLLEYIEALSDLDIQIKKGTVSKDLCLELFILKI